MEILYSKDGKCNLSDNKNEARVQFICDANLDNFFDQNMIISMNNNNMDWNLAVYGEYGEINISLRCPNDLTATFQIKSRLSMVYSYQYVILHEANLIFNKPLESIGVVRNCIIEPDEDDRSDGIIFELLLNAEESTPPNHKAPPPTTIDDLKRELAYFKEDENTMRMFKEVLCLFKSRALQKFEHEMALTEDVKVHLRMIPITDSKSHDDDEKQKYEQRQKELEALVTDLREQLVLAKSNRQATDDRKSKGDDDEKQAYEQRFKKLEAEMNELRRRLDDTTTSK